MTLTQEMASIARVITSLLPDYQVFYNSVPDGYTAPALYFPAPTTEIYEQGLHAYSIDYSWYIKVFDKTTSDAWNAALKVQSYFKSNKNLVPIVDRQGNTTGKYFRIRNINNAPVEANVTQLYVRWEVVYGYNEGDVENIQNFNVRVGTKGD